MTFLHGTSLWFLLTASLAAALPTPRTWVYKTVDGLGIKADVHEPAAPGPRPVVVYLHGGSLINGRRENVRKWAPAEALVGAGIVVVSIDYRLAPETKLPGIAADLEDGFRWVREHGPSLFGADPGRVAVAGTSAGGYLALLAGHRVHPRPLAVVAEMGYGNLIGDWQLRPSIHPSHYHDSDLGETDAWRQVSGPPIANADDRRGDGGAFNDFIRRTAQWPKAVSGWDPRSEAEKFTPYLPVRHVTRDFPPTFLLNGRADTDVPFSEAEQMAAEFLRHGVEHRLVGLADAEHGFRGADPAHVAAAHRSEVEFLRWHLTGTPPRDLKTYVYKRVGPLEIKADVLTAKADGPRPVVVWIHGGGLINGSRERDFHAEQGGWLGRLRDEHGIVLVTVDYRLAPETKLADIVGDIEDALRWVRAEGPALFAADPSRIAVAGGSAGGYLALTAAARVRPALAAVVSLWGYGELIGPWYTEPSLQVRHRQVLPTAAQAWREVSGPPIANVRDRAGSGQVFYQYCRQHGLWPWAVSGWNPWTEPERFTPFLPLKRVSPGFPPAFLVHGESDTDVPHEQSVMMAAELKRHGVEHQLTLLPGAEHGLRGGDPQAIERIFREAGEFLHRHLRPPAAASR
jgi:acetyl esterase/lipase